MLEPGTTAPTFDLPAAVDGEITTVDLSSLAGTDVLVVAFYPADFSDVCTEELCSLRDFELFDLQKDVRIVAVSTDTAFSHRRFAETYGLDFPLLSDNDGSVAESYGVLFEEALGGHRRIAQRAVFVLDADRTVQYAWASDDPDEMPDLDPVRAAIEDLSDNEAAVERYRVARAHYDDATERFETGLAAAEAEDWVRAADEFGTAVTLFEEAVDAFEAAVRFAGADRIDAAADRGRDVGNHYRNAAKWYASASDHFARGETEVGGEFQADAEAALASARDHDGLPATDALAETVETSR